MFLVLIVLWRPQKNNARYGMMEVAQEDDNTSISTSGTAKLKMRAQKKKGRKASDEEDALQWVEDNISDTEEPAPL